MLLLCPFKNLVILSPSLGTMNVHILGYLLDFQYQS